MTAVNNNVPLSMKSETEQEKENLGKWIKRTDENKKLFELIFDQIGENNTKAKKEHESMSGKVKLIGVEFVIIIAASIAKFAPLIILGAVFLALSLVSFTVNSSKYKTLLLSIAKQGEEAIKIIKNNFLAVSKNLENKDLSELFSDLRFVHFVNDLEYLCTCYAKITQDLVISKRFYGIQGSISQFKTFVEPVLTAINSATQVDSNLKERIQYAVPYIESVGKKI